MKWIYQLRHWQVFILLLLLPFVVSIIDSPGPTFVKMISNAVAFLMYSAWLLSISLASDSTRQIKRILTACFTVLTVSFFAATLIKEGHEMLRIFFTSLTYLLLFVVAFVTGKRLSLAESEIGKSKHPFLNALLVLVFPIGVWFVQPVINRLAEIRG